MRFLLIHISSSPIIASRVCVSVFYFGIRECVWSIFVIIIAFNDIEKQLHCISFKTWVCCYSASGNKVTQNPIIQYYLSIFFCCNLKRSREFKLFSFFLFSYFTDFVVCKLGFVVVFVFVFQIPFNFFFLIWETRAEVLSLGYLDIRVCSDSLYFTNRFWQNNNTTKKFIYFPKNKNESNWRKLNRLKNCIQSQTLSFKYCDLLTTHDRNNNKFLFFLV